MNVIVLVAGKGTRFNDSAPDEYKILTKCLLRLNGETILDRQIRLLYKEGLTDITLVVSPEFPQQNYKAKYLVDVLPHYSTSATWSLKKCVNLFRENGTLIMMGDVVFTEETLKEVLSIPYNNLMFVISKVANRWKRIKDKNVPVRYSTDEGYMVLIKNEGVNNLTEYLGFAKTEDGYGIHYIANKMRNVKHYIPKGFMRDIDFYSELVEVKKHIG